MHVTGESSRGDLYRTIWDGLDRAYIIPFLGAGASVVSASTAATTSLPTGRQLASSLATLLNLPQDELDCDDLSEVASCLAVYASRYYLEDKLKAIFAPIGRFGLLHQFLARLIPVPRLIITTNYDALVEEAFRSENLTFHLLMSPMSGKSGDTFMWWRQEDTVPLVTNSNNLWIEPDDVPIIYKIHGGVAPDGNWITSIITEEDYFEIGARLYSGAFLPPQLGYIIHNSSMLFLGYSLRDAHARFLVRSVTSRQRRHFLVSKQIARIDHIRFEGLGVTVIESPIDQFLDQLTAMKTS